MQSFASSLEALREKSPLGGHASGNTVIGIVGTNARLSREELTHVATMAHDGIARAVSPAHTLVDGDTIFALATGERPADPSAPR